ncbi:Rab3 GTPase-activating protein non-catalytic subunit [Schistosoma japonicum]|nr:Rab3 GTPase-activating protein non-catalytic subunit [Schistosoma japonicum]
MSLDALLKCDFSEVELPSGWIRKVLFCIPSNLKVVVIGVQNRMLVFGGNDIIFLVIRYSELKFQSCIKAISCLCFSSNNGDFKSGWHVYAIGLDNGELLFLHENNKILLCIRTGLDSVTSIQLTSCCKNLCVLCRSTIVCLNLEDLESVLLISCTHLSEHTLRSFENSTFQFTKTIRYQLLVIPTDGEKKHFSCLSKYQLGTFDLLVRTNTDPGVSHFASFVYQEAKRAMFGIRKLSNNDPALLTVTWPQQKDDITYPIAQCSPLLKKTLNLSHGLADSRRYILSSGVAVSPDHHWLAIPDSLGRVLLVDVYKERVVRMWKGYRDAEVAFLEVCDSETPSIGYCNQSHNPVRKTLCLLIHAPHLHSLELWCLIHGPRIVLWDVVEPVRLIKTEYNSYVNTLKSNELSPKYLQVVLIDSSGCIYAIGLNASLCLSDTNTQAAVDYQEYKVLQTVYEAFDQCCNNTVSDLSCSFVSDLLARFQTTQWFERALTHILSYPNLSPQMILDIITSYIQLIRKDDNTSSQMKNMNLMICSNVEHLVKFYLTFYSFYDVDSNEVKVKCEFTENSLRSCVEFVADLLSWDPDDAERCLQLYAICGSILSGSTSSDGKPLSIQMFLNSFQYTLVENNEIENALADSPEHDTEYMKQFHLPVIRSDNCRKTLTSFGSYIFRPYINGLQNFNSFQTIIESSNLDPKLLLFSFTLFILNEDNYWNFPNLVDRIHRIYCYIIYQILVALFSLPSNGMDERDEFTGGNSKNETDFRAFLDMKNIVASKQQSCSEFELTFKQVYYYCLDSYHLSSAYSVALVIRSILLQIWQTFGSEENILKVLYDYAQRPEFTIGSSSQRFEFNENTTNTQISSLKMSPTLFNYLTSNLQHSVDKWHHTCAQLEDLLTVGLMLLCPMNLKNESQSSHHAFDFNLRLVLTLGRCYLTEAFASWIVKTAITPEQVLNFYQGMCLQTLSIEDNDDNTKELVIRDPAHIRQVIFSLAYKRLPFTLELDTILSTACWIHFQSWLSNPEHINHLISCIEFFDRFSSAGIMIAQGLGTIMWNKGFMDWIKPILAIANGDKTFLHPISAGGGGINSEVLVTSVLFALIEHIKSDSRRKNLFAE